MQKSDGSDDPVLWRPLPLLPVLRAAPVSRVALALAVSWVAITAACALAGIYPLKLGWNGIPVNLGRIHFSVTIYPPLVVCVWMVFWVGFEWAFLSAYVSTLVVAIYVGMALPPALLFALVDPLSLAVYALAYRTVQIPFDLRGLRSVVWFIVVSFVAAVAGSTGSFVWSQALDLPAGDTLAIWQGWWVGALLQALLINGPVLALFSRKVDRWKQRHFAAPVAADPSMQATLTAIGAGGLVLAGFLLASSELATSRLLQALSIGVSNSARNAILDAAYSWKLTLWTGMALTMAGSLGGMFLAYMWSRTLFREVRARTAEVQESEQRFRATFEQAAVGIAHLSLSGQWLRVNHKLCEILGYSREELMNLTFQDLTHPDDLAADLENVERTIAGELETYTMEKRYIRKNGEPVNVRLTVSLARGAHDEPRYFISIIEDATARKQLEEQLRQSQKMEAIGRLAGGVAHDFNNLLTVIGGYAALLRKDAGTNSTVRDQAGAISEAADRASTLTRQLLAFSRRQVVQPQIVDLNDLVANMQDMLQRLIGETVVLRTVPSSLPVKVKADPGQIEQVIVNLAVNARDAMPEGGRLTISLGRGMAASGRVVTVEIQDTGSGMTPEVQSHLFEPFFTTKARGRGTGLGLSIVYGIVKHAGGSIAVETQEGRGTTFRIELPEVEGVVTTDAKPPAEGVQSGSETVLLVEDEEVVRNLAAQVLRSSGYTVLEAASGEDALRVCEKFEGALPLLVTDMIMPGMNGRALADRLRRMWPELKVLYMSGYTDNMLDFNDGSDAPTSFLQKPFMPTALAQKVRELLDARKGSSGG